MRLPTMLLPGVLFAVSTVASAYHGAGAGSYLDVVARDLTSSAQNLSYIVHLNSGNSDAYQDAMTLVEAAQHFQEEVELGPEDLDVDFNTIEETINELKTHFTGCHAYAVYPEVRSAWFRVEEANIRLRQAWLGLNDGGGDHGPGFPGGGHGPGFPGGDHGPGFPGGGHGGPWGPGHGGPWGPGHGGPWGPGHGGPWGPGYGGGWDHGPVIGWGERH